MLTATRLVKIVKANNAATCDDLTKSFSATDRDGKELKKFPSIVSPCPAITCTKGQLIFIYSYNFISLEENGLWIQ